MVALRTGGAATTIVEEVLLGDTDCLVGPPTFKPYRWT